MDATSGGPTGPHDPVSIGGYVLRGRLGVADSGVTYLAAGAGGGNVPVAVKWFGTALGSDEFETQFLRMIAGVPSFRARSVADVVDGGLQAGRPFVVSRYCSLPTLSAELTGGGLPEARLGQLALATVKALSSVHSAGWHHGGLRPANVLVDAGATAVCLVDVLGPILALVTPQPDAAAEQRQRGSAGDVAAWGQLVLTAAAGGGSLVDDPSAVLRDVYGGTPFTSGLARIVTRATTTAPHRRPNATLIAQWLRPLVTDLSDSPQPRTRIRRGGDRRAPENPVPFGKLDPAVHHGAARLGPDESLRRPVSVQASMPPELVPDGTALVTVSLTGRQLRHPQLPTATGGDLTADPSEPLVVEAVGRRNLEIVGQDRFSVAVPTGGNARAVAFLVRPTGAGQGSLAVTVSQYGLPLLEPLVLTPTIAGRPIPRRARAVSVAGRESAPDPPLAVTGTIERMPAQADAPAWTLSIQEAECGSRQCYRYEIRASALGILERYTSDPINGNPSEYIGSLYRRLEDCWMSCSTDPSRYEAELRAYGGQLFDELIPDALKRVLWEHRETLRDVLVLSDEPFIPWELLHLKDPAGKRLPAETYFLGEMGLVRWRWCRYPPPTLRVRAGRARHIIPTYPASARLPAPVRESEFMQRVFDSREVVAHHAEVLGMLQHDPFDLLHFAGHAQAGSADDMELLLSGRSISGPGDIEEFIDEPLRSTVVEQYFDRTAAPSDADAVQPIVVINACEAGRSEHRLTRVGGFADAFVQGGAGAFIGTLWSVGDRLAQTFVESFYTALLSGQSVSSAAIAGRCAARRAGDASWLAYVVYANPQARLDPM